MRKLRLDLEKVVVESFETDAGGAEPGTVLAHGNSGVSACVGTCDTDCWGMCGPGGSYDCANPTVNPEAADCYSYVIDCPQTDPVFYCGDTAIVYCDRTRAQCYPWTSPELNC